MIVWCRDAIREGTYQGCLTSHLVQEKNHQQMFQIQDMVGKLLRAQQKGTLFLPSWRVRRREGGEGGREGIGDGGREKWEGREMGKK